MMHIEVIGPYEVVLEAYPTLSSSGWTPYLTIYRGHAAAYKSTLVLQRQAVAGTQEFRSKEQAIEMARFCAARKIAKGKF